MGELQLIAGEKFAGKVRFPSIQLPKDAKIRLSREGAWDWIESKIQKDGTFTFSSLPPEAYNISVVAPGFAIDASEFRYQITGKSSFALRLPRKGKSITDIQIPMRPEAN